MIRVFKPVCVSPFILFRKMQKKKKVMGQMNLRSVTSLEPTCQRMRMEISFRYISSAQMWKNHFSLLLNVLNVNDVRQIKIKMVFRD